MVVMYAVTCLLHTTSCRQPHHHRCGAVLFFDSALFSCRVFSEMVLVYSFRDHGKKICLSFPTYLLRQ